jgi:hypothetical protein
MNKARIVITVEREKEFTNEEVKEIMNDIKARLQGHYTKTIEPLKTATLNIGYEKIN